MLGLRFYFNEPHMQSWPTDGTPTGCGRSRALGRRWRLRPPFLPVVGQIAERHLRLIVDHMGVPRAKGGSLIPATCRNSSPSPGTRIRRAGSGGPRTPFRSIHPPLRQVATRSGRKDVLGHRHHPHAMLVAQCVTLFTEELPWLTGHDLELVMGRAFCDWIGWKLPER